MASAASTSPGASAANQSTSALPSSVTAYACTACQIPFPNGQGQRIHMKEPWHIYNIKRRIASLPPVPSDVFHQHIERTAEAEDSISRERRRGSSSSGSHNEQLPNDDDDNDTVSPFQCLFCNLGFPSTDDGLASNADHMRTTHGLFIPNPQGVMDMESFIGYLATEVREWHECLYCGATKPSTLAIQSHMRDKGHCQLNLDREPELLEFWNGSEPSDGEEEEGVPAELTETEMRFTSGKVVESRHAGRQRKKAPGRSVGLGVATLPAHHSLGPDTGDLTVLADGPQVAPGRQLARREEMGIVGVSDQQRRALVLAEKKAQRSEAVAQRAREWVYASGANAQKFDQLNNSKRKWGKQNHKLMPR